MLPRWVLPSFLTSQVAERLLAVELDDELFLHRRVDLFALGPLEHLAREALVVCLQPRRDGGGEVGRVTDDLLGVRPRLERAREAAKPSR
jgi:hypothetical protein